MKHLPARRIFPALAALSLAPILAHASDESPATPQEYSVQQALPKMKDGVRELLSHGHKILRILTDMTSNQKAEENADELTAEFNAFTNIEYELNDVAEHISSEMMEQISGDISGEVAAYEDLLKKIPEQLRRLHGADYYNSKELTAAIAPLCEAFLDCDEAPHEQQPKQATVEQISQLVEMQAADRKQLLERCPDVVQGGPGFTRDSAWVILSDSDSAVRMEYDILCKDLHYPAPSAQQLIIDGSKAYDKHIVTILLGHDQIVFEQWFDISRYWQKSSPKSDSAESES